MPEDVSSARSRGWTRTVVRGLVRRYYSRVEISGAEQIPQTGPVLICANHANSLVDPVLIGVAAGRPVQFMAKAPLFDNPVLGPPMKALGMVPAFRGSDDKREVSRNLESLDVGARVLVAGQAMGIFPEGKSTDQPHLEMIRSGAARMALQAVESGTAGLQIVPLGLAYDRKDAFRSTVWIQVGEPIDVDAWLAEQAGPGPATRRALTKLIEQRLKEVVIHLDEPEWEPWLDDLEVLAPQVTDPAGGPLPPLVRRKRVADVMNYFLEHDRQRAEDLADDIQEYRENVIAAGLTINSPVLRHHGLKVTLALVWHFICLVVLFVPAVCGTLQHLVPFVVVRALARRLDQPGRKTISTNRLLVGVPVYLAWYGLVAVWMFGYFANWVAWTWLSLAPLAGLIAVYYWRRAGQAASLLVRQWRVVRQREKLRQLRAQEAVILGKMASLAEEFAQRVSRPVIPRVRVWPRRAGGAAAAILGLVLLMIVAWIAKVAFFGRPIVASGLDLSSFSESQVETLLNADEATLTSIIGGVERLETEARQIQADFAAGRRSFATQGDNDDVRELLRRFVSYNEALLRIVWRYQRHGDIQNESQRLRAFLCEYTAACVLYDSSLKFVDHFGDSRTAIAKLNEEEPSWGIPTGLYDRVRQHLANPENIRLFESTRQFYHQDPIQQQFAAHDLAISEPYRDFHAAIAVAEQTIAAGESSLPERIVEVAVTDLERLLYNAQYETQSVVSTWIGDIKVREPRDGKPLIDKAQLARLASLLKPGDILLERRNWYLSNAFLPGYWPHGAVYVGTAKDLERLGLDTDPAVRQHWEAFTSLDDGGHEHVIIEAVSEGVIFSSLEHSIGGADAVAVLRPRVSEQEKNESIARAFSFVGRPYDFEFDFETTNALVCTEVVFRAYGGNSRSIRFPLEEIMGRRTMPAINLVKKFNEEYGSDDAQFEFVALIDGDEQAGTSTFSTDVDAFRGTADRFASSFLQGSSLYAVRSIGPLGWVLVSLTAMAGAVLVGTGVRRRWYSKSSG